MNPSPETLESLKAKYGEVWTLRRRDRVYVLRCPETSEYRRYLATLTEDRKLIFDARTGQLVVTLKHESVVRSARFSPDGEHIVTASDDSTARIWSARHGELLMEPLRHKAEVWYAEFSPDGRQVATASMDRTAQLWDVTCEKSPLPPLRQQSAIDSAAFSADGRFLAYEAAPSITAYAGTVFRYNIGSGATDIVSTDAAVLRVAPFVALAYTTLVAWAASTASASIATFIPLRPWYTHKQGLSFADVLRAVLVGVQVDRVADGRRLPALRSRGTAAIGCAIGAHDFPAGAFEHGGHVARRTRARSCPRRRTSSAGSPSPRRARGSGPSAG